MLVFVPLGDKYERRSLISTLLVAASIALAFTASSPNVVWLSVAGFVVGLTASTVQVIVPFAAHHAPDDERGRIVGTVLGGLLVGRAARADVQRRASAPRSAGAPSTGRRRC